MYGIIGSAIAVGALSIFLFKRLQPNSLNGEPIAVSPKPFHHGTWLGGMIFGMGWALTGACPGPLYVHVGAGTPVMIIAIFSALLGTFAYSALRPKLRQ